MPAVMDPMPIRSHGIGQVLSNAARKPSITPAMGYKPYHSRRSAGSFETGHTTGAAYISAWITNPIAWRMSRYWMASAESNMPMPADVNIITTTSSGRNTTFHEGRMRYQTIRAPRKMKAMAKSTNFENTGTSGKNTR